MATGRRRSSVGRLLNALAPKRGPTIAQTIDLSPLETDLLISYQLSLSHPAFLGPLAFSSARVASSDGLSTRIYDALLSIHAINAPSDELDETAMSVDTTRITRNFANQLFFCNGHVLRRIVALLFVFEEQGTRLRMLDAEEREIKSLLANPPAGLEDELKLRLRAVQKRRSLLPSQQQDQITSAHDAPPAYS